MSISNLALCLFLSSHSKNLLPLPLFLLILLSLPLPLFLFRLLFLVIPLFLVILLFLFIFFLVLQLAHEQQVDDELPVIEQLLQGFVALCLKLVYPLDLLIERGVHLRWPRQKANIPPLRWCQVGQNLSSSINRFRYTREGQVVVQARWYIYFRWICIQ